MAECGIGIEVCCLRTGCVKVAKESITASGTSAKCVTVSEIATAGGVLTLELPALADVPQRLRLLMKIDAAANAATIIGNSGAGEDIEGGNVGMGSQYDHVWLWPGPTCWIKVGGNV